MMLPLASPQQDVVSKVLIIGVWASIATGFLRSPADWWARWQWRYLTMLSCL
jgi:hypothetical protein